MIVQIKCPHCGVALEADAEERSIFCPQCEKEISLKNNPAPAPAPAHSGQRLIHCADCAQPMSRRALWCQQCGSLQRSLFAFVFAIVCEFYLVTAIFGLIGWGILKIIGILIPS